MYDDGGPLGWVRAALAPAAASGRTRTRAPVAWRRPAGITVGVVGVALYNWWVVVALHSHLMTTPDELFSDLEATGRPDAALLQRLDLAAGLLLITALLVRGRRGPDGARAEWPWLVGFAASGAVGGHYAYACAEGISASCRSAEWRLALPPHHYVHVLAGVLEFATATIAVYLAWQRTRAVGRPTSRTVRWTGRVLVAAYPLLGVAYFTDRLGAFVEPIFFVAFSVMVLVELAEPDRGGAAAASGAVAGGGASTVVVAGTVPADSGSAFPDDGQGPGPPAQHGERLGRSAVTAPDRRDGPHLL